MDNLKINLDDSNSPATIIYKKILSFGFYYFKEKSIADWFINQFKSNGVEDIYIIEEMDEFLGNSFIRYAIKYNMKN